MGGYFIFLQNYKFFDKFCTFHRVKLLWHGIKPALSPTTLFSRKSRDTSRFN